MVCRRILLTITLALVVTSHAFAAGGYSHFFIAKNIASMLGSDPRVPADLRQALRTPEGLNAFCSGAVAPDIGCISERAHNNKTTILPKQIMKLAQDGMKSANAMSADDPNKSAALKDSLKNLAFAYGWYSHVATDLDVHPEVNAAVGDSWAHNNLGDMAGHGSQEVQFDVYVSKTLVREGDKVDFVVPLDFLEKATGLTAEELHAHIRVLREKMIAGTLWKDACEVPDDVLKKRWEGILQSSLQDSISLVEKPDTMQDWDLDVGRMTTEEYELMRAAAIEANGGKLPKSFASHYLDWYRLVKGLPDDEVIAVMAGIIGKSGGSEIIVSGAGEETRPPGKDAVEISCAKVAGQYRWENISIRANGVELSADRVVRVSPNASGVITFRAMVKRSFYLPEDSVEVLKNTPYLLHYWKLSGGRREVEYEQRVEAEDYTWDLNSQRLTNPGNPYASGVNAVVKRDCWDMSVPETRTVEKKHVLKVTGRAQTIFGYNGKFLPANAGSITGSAELLIVVPALQ